TVLNTKRIGGTSLEQGVNQSGAGRGTNDGAWPVLVLCLLFGGLEGVVLGQQNGIAAGREHSLALRSDGQVLSFGDNGIGQLGNGTTISTTTNTADLIAGLTNVVGLACGGFYPKDSHSLVLKSDGT